MCEKMFSRYKTSWFLMTAPNILENTVSTLTGLKFEMLFLLSVPLSIDETAAIFAASGNIPIVKLSLIVFVRGSDKIFASSFTSFGGILSTPVAFYINIFTKGCYIRLCNRVKLKRTFSSVFSIISLAFVTLG